MTGIVFPEAELADIGGGDGGCAITETRGSFQIIHECAGQSGTFWTVESDGIIKFTAPEFLLRCGPGVEINLTIGRVLIKQGTATITIENGDIHLDADNVYTNGTLLSSRP